MFMGHYATALVPYAKVERASSAPFWLFLLAAQSLDILMLFFVSVGWESFEPHSYNPFTTKFYEMQTDMAWSHDLVPVGFWALVLAVIGWVVTKDRTVALWCAALVLVHEVFDLVVGFEHFVFGKETPSVGLQLYTKAALPGLLIEMALCAGLVWWFAHARTKQGRPLPKNVQIWLYAILVGGTVATLPMAI